MNDVEKRDVDDEGEADRRGSLSRVRRRLSRACRRRSGKSDFRAWVGMSICNGDTRSTQYCGSSIQCDRVVVQQKTARFNLILKQRSKSKLGEGEVWLLAWRGVRCLAGAVVGPSKLLRLTQCQRQLKRHFCSQSRQAYPAARNTNTRSARSSASLLFLHHPHCRLAPQRWRPKPPPLSWTSTDILQLRQRIDTDQHAAVRATPSSASPATTRHPSSSLPPSQRKVLQPGLEARGLGGQRSPTSHPSLPAEQGRQGIYQAREEQKTWTFSLGMRRLRHQRDLVGCVSDGQGRGSG